MDGGGAMELPCVLLLLVGPPATGKSSFAQAMVDFGLIDGDAVVSCDAIREGKFGHAADAATADPVVFADMDELVQQRLLRELPVVVDATNVTSQARLRMIAWAKAAGHPVWAARFRVDVSTALAQNAGRGKAVPNVMVIEYVELMITNTGDSQLAAEGVDIIVDVPGRSENVTPQEAVRCVFSKTGKTQTGSPRSST